MYQQSLRGILPCSFRSQHRPWFFWTAMCYCAHWDSGIVKQVLTTYLVWYDHPGSGKEGNAKGDYRSEFHINVVYWRIQYECGFCTASGERSLYTVFAVVCMHETSSCLSIHGMAVVSTVTPLVANYCDISVFLFSMSCFSVSTAANP